MWILIWFVTPTGNPGQPLFFEEESDCRLASISMRLELGSVLTTKCIQVVGEVR